MGDGLKWLRDGLKRVREWVGDVLKWVRDGLEMD